MALRSLLVGIAVSSTIMMAQAFEDRVHVSPQQLSDIRRDYPYLEIFDEKIFDECYGRFFDVCEPRLSKTKSALQVEYQIQLRKCDDAFCNCSNRHAPDCHTRIDTSCDVVDFCEPNNMKCIGRYVYNDLPIECQPFLQCTRDPKVVEREHKRCTDKSEREFPGCQAQFACSYVEFPTGPDDFPHHHTTEAPHAPKHSEPLPLSFHVFIACVATAGVAVVLLACVVVYSRMRRRHVIPGISPTLNVLVADPVRWFGLRQLDTNSTSERKCSVQTCGKTFTPQGNRLVVLPCRCEWCGCGQRTPSDLRLRGLPFGFTRDTVLRSYPGQARTDVLNHGTYCCLNCGEGIERIVDLSHTYITDNEETVSSEFAPGLKLAACCICLSEPARVVSLPCGHLTTCSSCAHRLSRAVPRRGEERSTLEVSCQCPQCRSVVAAMVVLDDAQVLHAKAAAMTRDGDSHPVQIPPAKFPGDVDKPRTAESC